ncbi:DoxX family protein [Mycolicibacterium fortuitum]|uniref:DoxX family protein n=2 Tax=Mycolicibacterium fortuitum TaxID=1766 RepID=A0AAE4VD46_MYCFO|nr:DoxX family protein [Mycolicibacterium fortuitum]MCV7141728.1 DoxX family protein [Mycolicibacterium fortuitum]MDV7191665.1 DoxX family protein [Mycolicibacterium fortuitum]MDV7204384.1 DoxX family protein [Mycolicibacterium fortuitum]MDV7225905.1 DoxX family protein [Mycolicibacterium fortuitum]MDV7257310.1 DoxX family protein [Mycolicibacterium fortuitum]
MHTTLWIITIVAAAAYAAGGTTTLLMSRERYRSMGRTQHWVDEFGDGHLKAIGAMKLLGAIGLVLPAALNIAPVLTPVAACGLALFMAGAATTRFRRSEWLYMAGDVVYLGVFVFLAWGWFTLPVT